MILKGRGEVIPKAMGDGLSCQRELKREPEVLCRRGV